MAAAGEGRGRWPSLRKCHPCQPSPNGDRRPHVDEIRIGPAPSHHDRSGGACGGELRLVRGDFDGSSARRQGQRARRGARLRRADRREGGGRGHGAGVVDAHRRQSRTGGERLGSGDVNGGGPVDGLWQTPDDSTSSVCSPTRRATCPTTKAAVFRIESSGDWHRAHTWKNADCYALCAPPFTPWLGSRTDWTSSPGGQRERWRGAHRIGAADDAGRWHVVRSGSNRGASGFEFPEANEQLERTRGGRDDSRGWSYDVQATGRTDQVGVRRSRQRVGATGSCPGAGRLGSG